MLELRLIVRAAHTIAAAAWVGGNILYLVAVIPALRSGGPAPAIAAQVVASALPLHDVADVHARLSGVLTLTASAERTENQHPIGLPMPRRPNLPSTPATPSLR